MDSKIGLVIQFIGIFLITVLSLFLKRSLKSTASSLWLVAWASLSCALFSLSIAFNYEDLTKPLFCFYFLGEYIFGLTLIGGCRSLVGKKPLNNLIFAPFVLIAGILPFVTEDFNNIFNFHSLILGNFFVIAFFSLGIPKDSTLKSFGWRVMRVAFILLAIDFYHNFILFTLKVMNVEIPFLDGYLTFNPVIDLVLEILLGFGMVIVLLEGVLREVRITNLQLMEAHKKLEQLAQTDPLTTAFNRHAFYGFLQKRGEECGTVSGCVGFFDIDDLKPINDQFGHAVGDMAIRAVARELRSLIRAEDLMYRWGGDEFFVIMVSLDAETAKTRMSKLENRLTGIFLEGNKEQLTIGVSYGFKDFKDVSELEQAVKLADEEMYRRKQERKRKKNMSARFIPPIQENRSHINL